MFHTDYAHLMREIASLKQEVARLKDEQIKKRRDDKDAIYNLDGDNVPSLRGIERAVSENGEALRLVASDGKVNAEMIIKAINGQSEAKIEADAIDLAGKVIRLTSDKIQIQSENFNVDSDGNMECNNAKIKAGCTLGSDLNAVLDEVEKVGITIGGEYTGMAGLSSTVSKLGLNVFPDKARGDNVRGVELSTDYRYEVTKFGTESPITEEIATVSANPHALCLDLHHRRRGDYNFLKRVAGVGIVRGSSFGTESTETEGDKYPYPEVYAVLRAGPTYLWINAKTGNLCTNASELLFGQDPPTDIPLF